MIFLLLLLVIFILFYLLLILLYHHIHDVLADLFIMFFYIMHTRYRALSTRCLLFCVLTFWLFFVCSLSSCCLLFASLFLSLPLGLFLSLSRSYLSARICHALIVMYVMYCTRIMYTEIYHVCITQCITIYIIQ